MCTMAAPASAAARHSSAICSGVIGTADPGEIGDPPVTAHVMIVSIPMGILLEKVKAGSNGSHLTTTGGIPIERAARSAWEASSPSRSPVITTCYDDMEFVNKTPSATYHCAE